MILVFYLCMFIFIIMLIFIFSKLEIKVQEMYFNNVQKFRNNEKIKITMSLKIGILKWLKITLNKRKIEKIYLKVKKIENKSELTQKQIRKQINKKMYAILKSKDIRKHIKNINFNLSKLNLDVRIANKAYDKTAYIVSGISILISNILPYIANQKSNIYYKVEPVFINQNAFDILGDFTINVPIYKIIFTLIRINKETNGKNITKKKEGKNYGRTSNRKFNEHSYE